MLINHKQKIIIYTPFKNYSTSMDHYFKDLDEWEQFFGIHPRIDGDCYDVDQNYSLSYKHGNIPPSSYISYKKILPLRNPYDRVLSMWRWVCEEFELMSFDNFFYKGAKYPAAFPVSRLYPHDFIVKTENLIQDLADHGIDIDEDKFPHFNASNLDIKHTLTEVEKEIIYWWHKEDFEAGNYEK